MPLEPQGLEHSRILPPSVEESARATLERALGVALVLGAAAGFACLMTWTATDPSVSQATGGPTRNLLGPVGASSADLLMQTLGFAAIPALFGPLLWGFELLSTRRIPSLSIKLALFPVVVLIMAGGFSALPAVPAWPLYQGYGGLLGDFVFNFMASLVAAGLGERGPAIAGLALLAGGVGLFAQSLGLGVLGLLSAMPRRSSRESRVPDPAQFEPIIHDHPAAPRLDPRLDGGFTAAADPEPMLPPLVRRSEPQRHAEERQPYPAPAADARAQYGAEVDDAFGDEPAARDDLFDEETDLASRALARRFAPPGASAPQVGPDMPGPLPEPRATPRSGPRQRLLKAIVPDRREVAYRRPSLNLLKRPPASKPGPEFTQTVLRGNARLLEDVLADFGVKGEVKDIRPGPVVTLFEFEPARGTKTSRVVGLADDIARSMSAASVRVAVVPGRNVIGIELPNIRREPVFLRELLESEPYKAAQGALPIALGKAIGGEPIVVDLARMPHLLVAGTTGSGKSVGVNAMILSLLYTHAPEDCRLLLIDPKMLELSVYNGIPHLLTPVVTDPQQAVAALNWVVREMEERYKRMAKLAVRNVDAYNNRVRNAKKRGEPLSRTVQTGFDPRTGQAIYAREEIAPETMPNIVVVVDEFADLMIVAGKDIEGAVQRLAQMARAAGIHLIMATQRPSVDIVTGTIKANFPSRISFKVASKVDSRTILNEQGAEQLLGQGDMLFAGGSGQMLRVHGAFVSDEEVEAIAQVLREQGEPRYVDGITDLPPEEGSDDDGVPNDGDLYARAVAIVLRDRKASTSYVQRRLSIGYNRAADLIERMEQEGLIGPPNHAGKREIYAGADGRGSGAAA